MKRLLISLLFMPLAAVTQAQANQEGAERVTEHLTNLAAKEKALACYAELKLRLTGFSIKEAGVTLDQVVAKIGLDGGSEEYEAIRQGYGLNSYLDDSLDEFFRECIDKT